MKREAMSQLPLFWLNVWRIYLVLTHLLLRRHRQSVPLILSQRPDHVLFTMDPLPQHLLHSSATIRGSLLTITWAKRSPSKILNWQSWGDVRSWDSVLRQSATLVPIPFESAKCTSSLTRHKLVIHKLLRTSCKRVESLGWCSEDWRQRSLLMDCKEFCSVFCGSSLRNCSFPKRNRWNIRTINNQIINVICMYSM